MGYYDELNADPNAAPNPGDPVHRRFNIDQVEQMGDPLLAGVDPGTQAPAPPYGGLTGAPLETMMVTSAQLAALAPQKRRIQRPPAPLTPFAGLSSYLGA